jgi:ribose 1,5-bisphosphokinase PhnN
MARGGSSGGEIGESGGGKVSVEDARREYTAVQTKIEAIKRAIEQKKKGL